MKNKKSLSTLLRENNEEAYNILTKKIIKNGLIKSFVLVLFIIFAILFLGNVSHLSMISPNLFFIIIFVVLAYILLTVCYYLFSKSNNKAKRIIYQFYDMCSFAGVLISILGFVVLFVFCPTIVDGSSMNNTFYSGDRLLVWHLFYTPKTDDIVIINVSNDYVYNYSSEERFFIKRIVATSGDTVYYQNNSFYVNDELIESNISGSQYEKMTSYNSQSILKDNKIIEGYSIVLGDNRSNSADSRIIGAIMNSDIEGKVIFRFYSEHGSIGLPKKQIK